MNDAELDPEIAALLSNAQTTVEDEQGKEKGPAGAFSFRKGFSKKSVNITGEEPRQRTASIHEVDLSKTTFDPIPKLINDTSNQVYDDPKYYKVCLTGEN